MAFGGAHVPLHQHKEKLGAYILENLFNALGGINKIGVEALGILVFPHGAGYKFVNDGKH